jgi:CRISPR system Cascade subunit CasB
LAFLKRKPTEHMETTTSDDVEVSALRAWWRGLDEHRGDRALLRRCRSIDDVLLSEAYHKLRNRLRREGVGFGPKREMQLAFAAGLLAHVRDDLPGGPSLLERMAAPRSDGSDRARLSGLRFRRLLRHESREALYEPMIRVIRLLDRTANVRSLARELFFWSPARRKTWARVYYENALDEA